MDKDSRDFEQALQESIRDFGLDLDVSRETMHRIAALEKKKGKKRGVWFKILYGYTLAASILAFLFSGYFLEYIKPFFNRIKIDPNIFKISTKLGFLIIILTLLGYLFYARLNKKSQLL